MNIHRVRPDGSRERFSAPDYRDLAASLRAVDGAPGSAPVAVLSHALWQRRFGGDPAVLGRGVRINGHPFTVIGVASERFGGTFVGFVFDL